MVGGEQKDLVYYPDPSDTPENFLLIPLDLGVIMANK